jgi:hypothetical protein
METKGIAWVVLVSVGIGLVGSSAWGKYGGGTGTASSPNQIYTVEHLIEVGQCHSDWYTGVHYRLMADIDLAGYNSPVEPIGTALQPFRGDFDGNGKTISNLKIECSSGDCVGLFANVSGDIHDVGLVNVEINAPQSMCVGALAGWMFGNLDRCYVNGGSITGADEVGGLVGRSYCAATQCYASCTVRGVNQVGGLFGSHVEFQTASQCYATCDVSGTKDRVGGLIGCSGGIVKDCYAFCVVSGDLFVGGLVGHGDMDGRIWNCYAVGTFTGRAWVSGVFGYFATAYSCFWDVQASGAVSTVSGVGKTTAQMQTAATFRGWGRSGAWTIHEGVDYPRLAWENRPGVLLTTAAFPDDEGQGAAQDPYLIGTAEQLRAIGNFPGEWDRHYRLVADIDLGGLATSFHMIGCQYIPFTGTFHGDGFSISNLVCPYASYGEGMFAWMQGATIKRVRLVNPRVDDGWIAAGPLVGQQVQGTVEACGVEGGLVNGASVYVGGLIGRCSRGTVTRCYSTCAVRTDQSAEDTGGLIGRGEQCNVNNAYATGTVDGLTTAGGLIGSMKAGAVSHCYSTGAVTGLTNVGGLVGLADGAVATGCFWDTQTSGQATSAVGTGLSTVELQQAATYLPVGWDFADEKTNGTADIWAIDEGRDYPRFFQKPDVSSVETWSDDFEDSEPWPLWQAYEPQPNLVCLQETNGRLELYVPEVTAYSVSAVYLSSDWALDGSQDFCVSVDYCFDGSSAGEALVSISVAPSVETPVSRRVELAAGCLDGESVYCGKRADGGFATWWAARGSDRGTLYLSYDAAGDHLYLSYVGFGPANAWRTLTGIVKSRWVGGPVYIILGGAADGVDLEDADAWLDNFAVQAGTILE